MSFCINWFGSRYPQNDKYLKRKIPKKDKYKLQNDKGKALFIFRVFNSSINFDCVNIKQVVWYD